MRGYFATNEGKEELNSLKEGKKTFKILAEFTFQDAEILAEHLKNTTTLEEISWQKDAEIELICEALKSNTSVQRVDFSSLSMNGARALSELIKNNRFIKRLDINYLEVNERDIANDVDLANAVNKANAAAITLAEGLRANTAINEFTISSAYIGDEGAVSLATSLEGHGSIKSFGFHFNTNSKKLYDKGLKRFGEALSKNTVLKTFSISCFEISDDGAKAFANALNVNQSLEELDLTNIKTSKGMELIGTSLYKNHTLKKLNFNYVELDEGSARAFSNALKVNQSLEELRFYASRITSTGMQLLGEGLGQSRTLRKINFDSCLNLGDGCAKIFAKVLEANKCLEEFSLARSQISSKWMPEFTTALLNNTVLRKLNISGNQIGDQGANSFAEMLKVNRSLKQLDLSSNNIGPEGIMGLAEALKINRTLVELSLTGNDISLQSINALIAVSNPTLKCLNVSVGNDRYNLKNRMDLFFFRQKFGLIDPPNILKNRMDLFFFQQKLGLIDPPKNSVILASNNLDNIDQKSNINPSLPQENLSGKKEYFEETVRLVLDIRDNEHSEENSNNNNIEAKSNERLELENKPILFQALVQLEKAIEAEQQTTNDLKVQYEDLVQQQTKLEEKLVTHEQKLNEATAKYESTQSALQNATDDNLVLLQEQLNFQQREMDTLKVQHAILWREHKVKEQRKELLERLQKFPNQWQFYRTIQLEIQKLFIRSISGLGETDGNINLALEGFDLFNDITNIVPIVGPAINAILKWTVVKLLEKLGETRQLNISNEIADLLTLSELKRMSEGVAQRLTHWYAPVLDSLATEKDEKEMRKVSGNNLFDKLEGIAKKTKQAVMHSKQESSAVKMAKFVIAWGLDAISEMELGSVANDNNNNVILPEKLLENRLVQVITHKKLQETNASPNLFNQTRMLTKDLVIKLSNFLIEQTIYINNEKLPLWRVLSECGMTVKENNQLKIYVVPYAKNMATIFGHCQGTLVAAQARGMSLQLTKSITASDGNDNSGALLSSRSNNQQLLIVSSQANQLEKSVESIRTSTNLTIERLERKNEDLTIAFQTQSHEIKLSKQQHMETLQQVALLQQQVDLQQQQIKQLLTLLSIPSQQLSQQMQADDSNDSQEKVTHQLRK